jgi:hypothetical protein
LASDKTTPDDQSQHAADQNQIEEIRLHDKLIVMQNKTVPRSTAITGQLPFLLPRIRANDSVIRVDSRQFAVNRLRFTGTAD